MKKQPNNKVDLETRQLVRLARAIYELGMRTKDKEPLEIIADAAGATKQLLDEAYESKKANQILHPDLGLELLEFVYFKLDNKQNPKLTQHIAHAKYVDTMLKRIERQFPPIFLE